ncbi:MAG: hypothetical protein R8L53_09615 [Mariprofundales bacterium]
MKNIISCNFYSLYSLKKAYCLIILLCFSMLIFQGCAMKWVSDYDARLATEIIDVSKQVDTFYGELIETEDANRGYDKFKDRYIQIEVNIRALLVQNMARQLNDESISIAETILEKWLKYKTKHKLAGIYKSTLAKNHRKRFTRLFTAMSVAEEAKRSDK